LAHFKLGVKANVELKLNIPIGAKVEIHPKGFTQGVKAKVENIFPIYPKLLTNVKLYDLVLALKLKKDTIKFGKPICNP
jgi:hypothetical protein